MKSSTSGSSRCFVKSKPVCVMAGFLLCHSVEALVPSIPMRRIGSHQRRSCVRRRGTDGLRCSASDGETESPDSSEIYAAVRRRLQVGDCNMEFVGCNSCRWLESLLAPYPMLNLEARFVAQTVHATSRSSEEYERCRSSVMPSAGTVVIRFTARVLLYRLRCRRTGVGLSRRRATWSFLSTTITCCLA